MPYRSDNMECEEEGGRGMLPVGARSAQNFAWELISAGVGCVLLVSRSFTNRSTEIWRKMHRYSKLSSAFWNRYKKWGKGSWKGHHAFFFWLSKGEENPEVGEIHEWS